MESAEGQTNIPQSEQTLTESFFERITEEQLGLLKSGNPDPATKILLAELILDMIRSVTGSVLTVLKDIYNVDDQEEQPNVDQVTTQISSRALGINDQVDCVSSRSLSDLLAEEVRKNVDSALSSGLDNPNLAADQSVTQPHRISTMVLHATRMMRELSMKMKNIFTPCRKKQRSRESRIQEDVRLSWSRSGKGQREKPDLFDTGWPHPRSSVGQKTHEIPELLQGNWGYSAAEKLQEDISKDLNEILTPLLEDLPENDFWKLQSEIEEDLEILSEEVGQVVCSKDKSNLQLVRLMIKEFLAKSFAKVWIHRFLIQLKKKHRQYSSVDSSALVDLLVETFTSLSQQDEEEMEEENKETLLFRGISSGTVLVFTKHLSDLIYPNFLPQTIPDSALKDSQNLREVEATHANTYADIQSKVWVFVVLLNWWLKTQGKTLSERVNVLTRDAVEQSLLLPAEDIGKTSIGPRYEEGQQDGELVTERKSMLVKLLIEKVLWEIYCDVKMLPEKKDDMTNRLFQRIWAEVQQAQLFVTVKNLKSTSIKIYKQLCKMWSSSDQLLCLLIAQDANTELYITSVFMGHLTSPAAKPGYFRNLLSSLGRAVTRPFRNTDKTLSPFFEMLSS